MKQYIFIGILSLLWACGSTENKSQKMTVTGYAQGTTYSVIYLSKDGKNYQRAIDSTLIEIDNSLSTYQKRSIISRYNQAAVTSAIPVDEFFTAVFQVSKQVYRETDGAFDPTVAPLVNAWGFGFEKTEKVDSALIDSILNYVKFDSVQVVSGHIHKLNPVQIDFNAVAQGYTVDVLAELLEQKGIQNYMVEVGGEVKTKGINAQDTLGGSGLIAPCPI